MSKEAFDILIGWVPMLLVIAAWFFIFFWMRRAKPGKQQQIHYDLMRRQAEALERIAAALEKKS